MEREAFSSPRAHPGAQVSFWIYFYIPHLSGDMARFWTARSEEGVVLVVRGHMPWFLFWLLESSEALEKCV